MKKINDIKLKYKLILIYFITGIVPLVILFLFSFTLMKNILVEKEEKNIQNFLNQSVTSIDNKIEIYNNLSNYIIYNDTISKIVSYDYKNDYDLYSQLVNTLDPMLFSLKSFHNDIKQVTIYTDSDIRHDTTIAPLKEIENKDWFISSQTDKGIKWYADIKNKKIYSARKMSLLYDNNKRGILYVEALYDQLFAAFENNADDNYGIYITDSDGKLIYEYSDKNNDSENKVKYNDFLNVINTGKWSDNGILKMDNNYTVVREESDITGWTAYMYKKSSLMSYSSDASTPVTSIIIVTAMVAVIGALLTIIFTSEFITNRIENLQKNMKKVEKGNLDVSVSSDASDEIGELINGFNSMIIKLNNLITEVYQGKINQKEYEMKALRAQINPHFLYNSLSLINWKALETDKEDISNITLELSNYYRTSLNKGKNTLTMELELSNMKSYLKIQQIMHDGDFDVITDVDEKIYPYESLNLILQPLVENAIDHGIDVKTDGKGVIKITGKLIHKEMIPYMIKEIKDKNISLDKFDDDIIFLSVEDNGAGMDIDTVNNFLNADSKGYGAKNVNERIGLYYGEQYRLFVESTIGMGTKISIIFPAKIKY